MGLCRQLPLTLSLAANGLSVALLMRSLALCNQVLSELRRVHFTGSRGTRSNQNAVPPAPTPLHAPSAITPPLLFFFFFYNGGCAAIRSRRTARAENKQTNKHTSGPEDEIIEGLLIQKLILLLLLFFKPTAPVNFHCNRAIFSNVLRVRLQPETNRVHVAHSKVANGSLGEWVGWRG